MSKKEELLNIKKMLAKVLFNFSEFKTTDDKTLIVDDQIEVGVNAYIYDENGEKITAPDGDYDVVEVGLVVVEGGMIKEIKPIEPEQPEQTEEMKSEEPKVETNLSVESPKNDELIQLKSELQSLSEKYDKLINVVNSMFKSVEKFSAEPVIDKIYEKEITVNNNYINIQNKSLIYFEKKYINIK